MIHLFTLGKVAAALGLLTGRGDLDPDLFNISQASGVDCMSYLITNFICFVLDKCWYLAESLTNKGSTGDGISFMTCITLTTTSLERHLVFHKRNRQKSYKICKYTCSMSRFKSENNFDS